MSRVSVALLPSTWMRATGRPASEESADEALGIGGAQEGAAGIGADESGAAGVEAGEPAAVGFELDAPGAAGFEIGEPGAPGFEVGEPGAVGLGLDEPEPAEVAPEAAWAQARPLAAHPAATSNTIPARTLAPARIRPGKL